MVTLIPVFVITSLLHVAGNLPILRHGGEALPFYAFFHTLPPTRLFYLLTCHTYSSNSASTSARQQLAIAYRRRVSAPRR
jgi:hypothetical protein